MNYRELGRTGLKVSEISLGCWTLGGPGGSKDHPTGWGPVDEKEVIDAVNYAVDKGVNHFDNADSYGEGKAERMLAKALGERTKQVIIASKVGWVAGTAASAYEPLHIRHQCEQSLVNLKRDYIDIYYFHHGDFGENDKYLADAIPVMRKLKQEGKIKFIGLSTYSSSDFLKLVPQIEPDVLQGSASAMNTTYIKPGNHVANLMKANNLKIVAFSPMVHGLLTGKYSQENPPKFAEGDFRARSSYFTPEAIKKNDERMAKIKKKFGDSMQDITRVMLQYVLSFDATGCVIPGFRNKAQVEMNLAAAGKPLTAEEVRFVGEVFND